MVSEFCNCVSLLLVELLDPPSAASPSEQPMTKLLSDGRFGTAIVQRLATWMRVFAELFRVDAMGHEHGLGFPKKLHHFYVVPRAIRNQERMRSSLERRDG